MARTVAAILAAIAVAAVSGAAAPAAASPAASPAGASRLLDVPFLPQSEDLCGGAALSMVLRYWGARGVYPDDFTPLVDRSAAGIPTDVLAADVRRRGWQAVTVETTPAAGGAWIRDHLERGRPVVALIEAGAGRFHYVVVVAWTGAEVVVHDPARAPFVVLALADFERAWAAARRWALLVLPPASSIADGPPLTPARTVPDDESTCAPLVASLVALARAGETTRAETGLLAAVQLCPRDPAAKRELAGLRFLQSRWAEASALAEEAAALDPADADGWDLLATSRFLNGEPEAALGRWNRIGRPSVDVVRVVGARRTRHPVVAGLVDLPPRALLTPERFGRAARRLDDLPSAASARLRYRPRDGGVAEVEAAVAERATLPRGAGPLVATVLRAAVQREVDVAVAAPTGSGELWSVSWRWWAGRPRVAAALAVPSPAWLPGVTTIESVWERPSYAVSDAASPFRPEHRRASWRVADWASSRVWWSSGLGLDRWIRDSYLTTDLAADVRFAADHVSVGVATTLGAPLGSGRRFATTAARAGVRSTREHGPPVWLLDAGVDVASATAPLDLWPGAGVGQAREPLLRAHPLLEAGVIAGPVFGRRLAHATVEYRRGVRAVPIGALQVAAFADAARAWGPLVADARWRAQFDVGLGARLVLPGSGGTMRADLARGLRDGGFVLSAGWQAPWPGRPARHSARPPG